MSVLLIVLGVVLFWYVCGILNVAGVQAWSPTRHKDFDKWEISSTLWVCYGTGPIFTLVGLVYLLFKYVLKTPIRLGTVLGRNIGRRLDPDRN